MRKIAFQKIFLYGFSVITLGSCNFNRSFKNQIEDKVEAERTALLFYSLLENKDFNKTHVFFSQKFLQVTDTSKLNHIFKMSIERLGDVKKEELEHWETNIVKGSNPISQYLLVYNVTRSEYNSKETITLEKENDSIKILSYNVNSDGFFAKEK